MSRINVYATLAAAALVAGCASAPEQTAEAVAEPAQDAAGAATTTVSALDAVQAAITPNLTVDAIDPAPESAVTCREMLKQGSNVIITQCMTLADWKKFERRQARDAQEIVRMLQGSAYR